ncbi:MAG: TolC family protein [Deltaproteobacteria bacterium]|nr:TolC family protein [Deltaproteobacteria bacterium]
MNGGRLAWFTVLLTTGLVPVVPGRAAAQGESLPPTKPALVAEEKKPELPAMTPGPNLTLAEALAAADKRNLSLASAKVEIEKAQAQLDMAWAQLYPAAQGTMVYMHKDKEDSFSFASSLPPSLAAGMPSGKTVISPQEDLKGTVGVSLPLVNAQAWMTIGAARSMVRAVELTVNNVRQQLLLGVVQAYYAALMNRSFIDLKVEQASSAAHHLDVAKARYDAGTGLRIDVIRAQTDLETARQELLTANLALDNARDALATLTGTQGLPMPMDEPALAVPTGDEAELVAKAGRSRADLVSKKAMVEAAEKSLDASWMQFLPTLDAAWQLTYQFTKPGDLGSPDRARWVALFTLTVPLYNQFRYADLDLKRASLRQAMIQVDDADRNLALEVRKARRDYLTALASVDIADRQAQLAKEALTLTEASYEAGTGTSLDVTDARRTANAAETNLVAQRLLAQMSLVALLRAVGEDMLGLVR